MTATSPVLPYHSVNDEGADTFERMYVEHRDGLFAFLVYRTGNRVLAEDLLGDVFERALRAHSRFDPRRGSQTTWLYAIALNRLRDHHRRAQVKRSALQRFMVEEPVGIDPPDEGVADRDRVGQLLAMLSQQDREIVALRFGADLTAAQIAKVTNQRLATVEGRLYRALRRLRDALEPEPCSAGAAAPEIIRRAASG
jgi:RNA polymerase sigma factor (sigma-70 family)